MRRLLASLMSCMIVFSIFNTIVLAEEETEEPETVETTEENVQEESDDTESEEETVIQEEEQVDQTEENSIYETQEESESFEEEIVEETAADNEQSYSAASDDYSYKVKDGEVMITKYLGTSANVVIPSTIEGLPVTRIWANAFANNNSLQTVVIPSSVKRIFAKAFDGCGNLNKVTIPKSVIGIGIFPDEHYYDETVSSDGVFTGCEKLKTAGPIGSGANIEFGWDNELPSGAFQNSSITSCSLPDSITSISIDAFNYCKNIKVFEISKHVTEIKGRAFIGCSSLEKIIIPENVKTMGNQVFDFCDHLKTAGPVGSGSDIEYEWKKELPDSAFDHDSIGKIIFPDGLEIIGESALGGTEIKEAIVPDSVKEIKDYAFNSCYELEHVIILSSSSVMGKYIFNGSNKLKTAGPIGSGSNIEYGWADEIPANAFYWARPLTSVQIPGNIKKICKNAFDSCSGLKDVSLSNSLEAIEANAFYACPSNITVHFYGTESEWKKLQGKIVKEGNTAIINAKVVYENNPLKINISNNTEIATNTSITAKVTSSSSSVSNKVTWRSSNEKTAVVDKNGKITAKAYGQATITAFSESNPMCSVSVTIKTRFHDVNDSNQSYYKPVYWGADNGVVAGFNGGEYFGPDEVCTRAQFVTFLWRLAGKPTGSKNVTFNDITGSENYFRAIKWAVSQGIIVGFKEDNTFRPDDEVTRGQVATMLWRYAGKKTPALPKTSPFTDINASNNAYRAVVWGQKAGVIKGYKDGTFQPDASCLRQHIVTFLYRYARDVMGKNVN